MRKGKLLKLSTNKQINYLLNNIIQNLQEFTQAQSVHIKKLTEIGIALSAEKNLDKLLEMIVDEARNFTNSDGGTLYLVDDAKENLKFEILQNESLGIRMGGTSGNPINWPPVPLQINGKPNNNNVSAYCVITGKTVNISDVYKAKGFNFEGTRRYDRQSGYRSKSMLVIPMKNHENEIIGVLQLINAQDPENGKLIAFSPDSVDMTSSLASQAAVAITNVRLIEELENLFEAFIETIAMAIDEKSPYTAGHIGRVAELTMTIAEKINESNKGSFASVNFSEDEMRELRIAAWMHDVGKITTPEYVVDKTTKLQTIFDRYELVKTRFLLIKKSMEVDALKRKIEILSSGNTNKSLLEQIDKSLHDKMVEIEEELKFLKSCNNPGEFMSDEMKERLNQIAKKSYQLNGKDKYLTENELYNLSIKKGSLTPEERQIIQNHAMVTYKMLSQLPFSKKLRNVPRYASGHHEHLDGTGYPLGLNEKDLPLQARIMALADIFEALTAKDRPYKKPMPLSKALQILGFMAKDRHIDPKIYEFFIKEKIYAEYVKSELNPEQIDIDLSEKI